jgi:hypothetical protein
MCLRILHRKLEGEQMRERSRDGPIAGLKSCETSGFAIGILVYAKADDGHGDDTCKSETVGCT